MDGANPYVCFSESEVLVDFMNEFPPKGDGTDGLEHDFILFCLSEWPHATIDWTIPGRARIIGMRPSRRKEVMLVTHVIRFEIDLH